MEFFIPVLPGCYILRSREAENSQEIQHQKAQYVLKFTEKKQISPIQFFLVGISVLIYESSVLKIDSANQWLQGIIGKIYDEFKNSYLQQIMIYFLSEICLIRTFKGNTVSYISLLFTLIENNNGILKLLEYYFQSATIAKEYEEQIQKNDFIRKQIIQISEQQKFNEQFLKTYHNMVKASIALLQMKMLLIQNSKTSHPTKDPKTNNNGENDIKLKVLHPVSGPQLLLFGEDSLESTTYIITSKQDDTQTTTSSMNLNINQPFAQLNQIYQANLFPAQNSQSGLQRQKEQFMPSFKVSKELEYSSSMQQNNSQNILSQMPNAERSLQQQIQEQNQQQLTHSLDKTKYQSNQRKDAINGYPNRGGMIEIVQTANGEQNPQIHQSRQDEKNESKTNKIQERKKTKELSRNKQEDGKHPKQYLSQKSQGVSSQEQHQTINEKGKKENKQRNANKKLKAIKGQTIHNSIVFQNFGNNNKFVQHFPPLPEGRGNQSQNQSNSSQNDISEDDQSQE